MWKCSAWAGLTAIIAGAGLLWCNPVLSATLDGFSIDTQDKAVTVTLFTDQRVPYSTETQGKQFTIVLPNVQLSPSQLDNGLPVVIDNKNRFIGRAVPTDDGQVKIILPNLPAEEYAISIQQKQGAAVARATGSKIAPNPVKASKPAPEPIRVRPIEAALPAIKPRPAVSTNTDSHVFEQVAARFQKRAAAHAAQIAQTPTLRLSPRSIQSSGTGNSTIWNPYVVRNDAAKNEARPSTVSSPSIQPAEPISTVSVADSLPQARQSAPAIDPLWYLHAVPPVNPSLLLPPADNLQGLAKAATTSVENASPAPSQTSTAQAATPPARPLHTLKEAFLSLPKWLLITVGLFFGGLGLFGLIGGLVLLKILFSQVQSSLQPTQPTFIWADAPKATVPQSVMPKTAPTPVIPRANPNRNSSRPTKNRYASQPVASQGFYANQTPLFEDTSAINTMDYLKRSANNVSEAVHNTALLKFPRTRQTSKNPVRR